MPSRGEWVSEGNPFGFVLGEEVWHEALGVISYSGPSTSASDKSTMHNPDYPKDVPSELDLILSGEEIPSDRPPRFLDIDTDDLLPLELSPCAGSCSIIKIFGANHCTTICPEKFELAS